MSSIISSLILFGVAIGFVAAVIAGIIKLILFYRRRHSYQRIFQFGLIGEVIGFGVIAILEIFFSQEINKWSDPEVIIAIPVYGMLIGIVIGTIISFFKTQSA